MATISEAEFLIKVRDLASANMKEIINLQKQVVSSGIEGNQKLGKEVGGLTKLYREQRMENRMQSFLFRESRGVVGALALGLTALSGSMLGTSDKMKELNNALNQGFIAFQGIDFALAGLGLGGPVGLAIAGLAGLGAAFLSFGNTASAELEKTRAKVESLSISLFDLISQGKDFAFENFPQDNLGVFAQKEDLEKRIKFDRERIGLLEVELAGLKSQGAAADVILEKQVEIQKADNQRVRDIKALNDFTKEQIDLTQTQIEKAREVNRGGQLGLIDQRFVANGNKPGVLQGGVKQGNAPDSLNFDVNAARQKDQLFDLILSFRELGTTAQNVNGLILSSTQGAAAAITDAFFGATQSIQKFFENMVKAIVQMMVEQLLVKGIFSILGGFLGGGPVGAAIAGGGSGLFGGTVSRGGGGSSTVTVVIKGDTVESRNRIKRAIERINVEERW